MQNIDNMKVGDAIKLLPQLLGQKGGQQAPQQRRGDITDRYASALGALDLTVASLREAENELDVQRGQLMALAQKLEETKRTIAQLVQEKTQLEQDNGRLRELAGLTKDSNNTPSENS